MSVIADVGRYKFHIKQSYLLLIKNLIVPKSDNSMTKKNIRIWKENLIAYKSTRFV